MSTYISGGNTNYGSVPATDLTTPSVNVAASGQTIFIAYYYRDNPDAALVSTPTWNGESFTELVNQGNIPGDEQQVLQVFYLTTASSGTFPIVASNPQAVNHAASWAVYSDVTSVTPIELEEQWFASGYTNPSLTITGSGTVLNILGASNWSDGFADVSATTWSPANGQTVRQSVQNTDLTCGWSIIADVESTTSQTVGFTPSASQPGYVHTAILIGGAAGPSITPSDPVVDGAEATITTSGLSGAITVTLGGYSLTTAGTLPNLTYTLDISSITANGPVSAPRIGESLTLSVTGDEGTATSTVATQAAAGMAAITLAGTLANETDSLIDGMQSASGLTVAVGDIMYYPTADTTSIAETGALTTDSESFTLILIQGGSATTAGNAYAFTVTPEAVTPAADDWPFSKGIRPTAPVTWTWGARHPLTGMRVRKFNG